MQHNSNYILTNVQLDAITAAFTLSMLATCSYIFMVFIVRWFIFSAIFNAKLSK